MKTLFEDKLEVLAQAELTLKQMIILKGALYLSPLDEEVLEEMINAEIEINKSTVVDRMINHILQDN